jgi:hypothetical protein
VRRPPSLLVPSLALAAVLTACSSGGGSSAADPDSSRPAASGIAGLQTVQGLSHTHLAKRSDYPYAYPQTPPLGGPHSPRWLRCDTYTEPVPNENAVHSIEHGGIWITYRPGLDAASVAKLGEVEKTNTEYVLVSPFPGLSSPLVVTSWGLQLPLESVDDPRLLQFVQTYAGGGQGGEPGYPCRKGGLTPEQARQYDASLPE